MIHLGTWVIFTHADQKGFKRVCDVSLASNIENKFSMSEFKSVFFLIQLD